MSVSNLKVLIRGGGELASAVAYRLAQSHFRIIMTETPHPEAVRRNVSFCEAVYDLEKTVEGLTARLVQSADEVFTTWQPKRNNPRRPYKNRTCHDKVMYVY